MFCVQKESYPSWCYDDALAWMYLCALRVKRDRRQIFLACGSHRQQVITLGRRSSHDQIDSAWAGRIAVKRLDRGGGATAHEPGQLVLYPVFDMGMASLSVPELVMLMEAAMIDFLDDIGIRACLSARGPGVFVDDQKIGFIGLRIQHGVISHGLAINVLNDAKIFNSFKPCGLAGLRVTTAIDHVELSKPLRCYLELLMQHFMSRLVAAINRVNRH